MKRTFLILLGFMFIFFPRVYASSDSCVLQITPDKTKINIGESVTLILSVSNINTKNGIAIYNGILDYDSDIFDVSVADSSNGLWKTEILENSITCTKIDLEPVKDDQEIGRIILKAKSNSNLEYGKKNITLKNNEFADESSFSIKDVSISVEVNKANEDLNDNNDNTTNNNNTSNSENNISANTNTNVNNNGNITNTIDNKDDDKANKNSVFVVNQTDNPKASGKENTGKSGKLPYAGIIKKCSIILGIIVAISGIYSYYKYRKI